MRNLPDAVTAALFGAALAGCGLLGPTPDVAAACGDVGRLVDQSTRANNAAVRSGPDGIAERLRRLAEDLYDRAESIEDERLRAAVVRLGDSYRETAAATSRTRIPDAGQVRRAAYDVDGICKG